MFKKQFIELKKDLKNFGLKPSEWRLKANRQHIYFVHREVSDLTFLAQIGFDWRRGQLALENLTLIDS